MKFGRPTEYRLLLHWNANYAILALLDVVCAQNQKKTKVTVTAFDSNNDSSTKQRDDTMKH